MARKTWSQPPAMQIDSTARYIADIATSEGHITLELLTQEAPIAVNNFVFLARQGFYDGIIFHRVIEDYVIQTGDPLGTGEGDPGYEFPDEPVHRRYTRGVVGMANSGPNTNGSQFFIVHGADIGIPPNYTIFGEVTHGMDVVDKIATLETGDPSELDEEGSRPINPPWIQSIAISQQ
jgi:cyclophilin family peptidyl-prolyl cis-trans isomerase